MFNKTLAYYLESRGIAVVGLTPLMFYEHWVLPKLNPSTVGNHFFMVPKYTTDLIFWPIIMVAATIDEIAFKQALAFIEYFE